jgi:hypothetical protein
MSARSYAVDDPLVGLFLRLAAHPDAAFIFTIFIFDLWNLSQVNYALFAGFVYQPSLQNHQPVLGRKGLVADSSSIVFLKKIVISRFLFKKLVATLWHLVGLNFCRPSSLSLGNSW